MNMNMRWIRRDDVPFVADMQEDNPFGTCPAEEWIKNTPAIGSVVESEGKILGFVFYELKKTRLLIHDFVVAPSARRMGVGSFMISNLFKKLTPKRSVIEASVSDDNLGAHLFLSRIGFRAVGVYGDVYRFVYMDS